MERIMRFFLLFFFIWTTIFAEPKVQLGADRFFTEKEYAKYLSCKIGLITNHTGVNADFTPTLDLILQNVKGEGKLATIFCPEHGLKGSFHAAELVAHGEKNSIPIFSLHGETRKPTQKMLEGLDLLIYDIQEIGSRSYTYATTLFYAMEAAHEKNIPVLVLDRPNPLGGELVDGPMLGKDLRSFLGYINVPFCHGMTIGELAQFFNEEYKIGCNLIVVPMKGWERRMTYMETGLNWLPTSPYIPEPDTPFYYASTGILGELELVNIGIGYTLPFKLVGAPWIQSEVFAEKLNEQKLPGVKFVPFSFRPFYGPFKGKECHGVKIVIKDYREYKPLSVQYLLLGILKSLYPKEVNKKLKELSPEKVKVFAKINGNEEFFQWLREEKYVAWKLMQYQKDERKEFLAKREKYLLYK